MMDRKAKVTLGEVIWGAAQETGRHEIKEGDEGLAPIFNEGFPPPTVQECAISQSKLNQYKEWCQDARPKEATEDQHLEFMNYQMTMAAAYTFEKIEQESAQDATFDKIAACTTVRFFLNMLGTINKIRRNRK